MSACPPLMKSSTWSVVKVEKLGSRMSLATAVRSSNSVPMRPSQNLLTTADRVVWRVMVFHCGGGATYGSVCVPTPAVDHPKVLAATPVGASAATAPVPAMLPAKAEAPVPVTAGIVCVPAPAVDQPKSEAAVPLTAGLPCAPVLAMAALKVEAA